MNIDDLEHLKSAQGDLSNTIASVAESLKANLVPSQSLKDALRAAVTSPGLGFGVVPRATMPHIPLETELLFDAIREQVQEWEQAAAPDEHVQLLCFLPNGAALLIEDLDYHGKCVFIAHGVDGEGHRCKLLLHPTQAQFLVRAVKEQAPTPERQPIGFRILDPEQADDAEA